MTPSFPSVRSWIALGAPLELLGALSIARIIAVVAMVTWPLGAALGDLDLGIAGVLVGGSVVAILVLQRAKSLTAAGCSVVVALASVAVLVGVAGSENSSRVFGMTPLMLSIGVFVGLFVRVGPMAAGLVSFGGVLTAVTRFTAGGAGMPSAPLIVSLVGVVALMTAVNSRTSRLAGALDPDTGTPNERGLAHHLDGRDEAMVVGTVQLRGIADVRTALGDGAAIEVLRRAVEDLGRVVPQGITIGRGANDEIVMLAPTFPLSAGADLRDRETEVAERIAELEHAVVAGIGSGEFRIGEIEVSLHAHLGIDVAPHRAVASPDDDLVSGPVSRPADHLHRSSLAARRAMESGRRTDRWDGRSTGLTASDLEILARLRTAAENGELSLVYQPLLRVPDGRIVSVEALLRWTPADGDPVPPEVFIPLAERTGLIDRLTGWVLDHAIEAQARWRKHGVDLTLSVNVSPRSLRSISFVDEVMSALSAHGVPPASLLLEVTESTAFDVLDAVERLRPLRLEGVGVAIDDFGNGFTSLTELPHLGLDELKIDRSFVEDALTWRSSDAIVRSVCELAHGIGLRAVAKGVEDDRTAHLMVALGYDLLQGYHFAHPMSEDDLLRRVLDQQSGRVDVTGAAIGSPLPPPPPVRTPV
ncbi:MAG: EAL domain-containing protein [Actinomycetota bacterium]